jgi:hypothetical protein
MVPLQDLFQTFINQGASLNPDEVGNTNAAETDSDGGSDTANIVVLDINPGAVSVNAPFELAGAFVGEDNTWQEDASDELMSVGVDEQDNEDYEGQNDEDGDDEDLDGGEGDEEEGGEGDEEAEGFDDGSENDTDGGYIFHVPGPSSITAQAPFPPAGTAQAGPQPTMPTTIFSLPPFIPQSHFPGMPGLIPQASPSWHIHQPSGPGTSSSNVTYFTPALTAPSAGSLQTAFEHLGQALGQLEEVLGDTLPNANSSAVHPHQLPVSSHSDAGARVLRRRDRAMERDLHMNRWRLAMTYYPHTGETRHEPVCERSKRAFFMTRARDFNQNRPRSEHASERLAPGYHILRCYEKDFEMWQIPHSGKDKLTEVGIFCPNAVPCEHLQDRALNRSFWATSRLSFLAHIPELSLVALGSPTGRVLLATPTRLESPVRYSDREKPWKWDHGIRIECILPKQSDEEEHRHPIRPLYGMALGRIPNGSDEKGRAMLPKRYRLMLHYKNHCILSYEISRKNETGKLCIF